MSSPMPIAAKMGLTTRCLIPTADFSPVRSPTPYDHCSMFMRATSGTIQNTALSPNAACTRGIPMKPALEKAAPKCSTGLFLYISLAMIMEIISPATVMSVH